MVFMTGELFLKYEKNESNTLELIIELNFLDYGRARNDKMGQN